MIRLIFTLCLAFAPWMLSAQGQEEVTPDPPMTLETLDRIIRTLDPEAHSNGAVWQMVINDTVVIIVTDVQANRMRAISPIREAAEITPEDLTRMMQANFDAALDARYAIAQKTLWAAYIHPLAPLEKNEFISGLGQVVNLAQTYGTLYSGGAMQYGGGDSPPLQRRLIEELLKQGEEI